MSPVVSREKRRLPGKMLGAPLRLLHAPPSQPQSYTSLGSVPPPALNHCSKSKSPSLGELRDPRLANFHLVPATIPHLHCSQKEIFSASKFFIERIFQIIVQYRNHLDLTSVRSWDTFAKGPTICRLLSRCLGE